MLLSLLNILSHERAQDASQLPSWLLVLLLLQWAVWRDGQFRVVTRPQIHHYILVVMCFSQFPIARCHSLLCPSLEIKLHQEECIVSLAMWRQIHDRIDWGQRKDPSGYCTWRAPPGPSQFLLERNVSHGAHILSVNKLLLSASEVIQPFLYTSYYTHK